MEVLFKLLHQLLFLFEVLRTTDEVFDFEQAFQSLQVLLVEDNCAVSVSLEVNTDVVVFCLLVEVFDSSGGEERLHSEVLLEVFGGRIVGVVGLYKTDCWIGWDVQVNSIV